MNNHKQHSTAEQSQGRHAVASRRGCSVQISDKGNAGAFLSQAIMQEPTFERHMTTLRDRLARIEVQSQFMEISLIAQDRLEFSRSAAALSQLAEEVPSDTLLRSAIQARLVSSGTADAELIRIQQAIVEEIKRLKGELALLR